MPGKLRAVLLYLKSSPPQDLVDDSIARMRTVFPGLPLYVNFEHTSAERIEAPNPAAGARKAFAQAATLSPVAAEDGVAIFQGLCPFLDEELTRELLGVHEAYFAHCTYCENVPAGFAPDFVSGEFLAELPEPGPADLRDFVFKNIEKYDAEILYRAPDLRQFRLDFSGETPRSIELIRALKTASGDVRYAALQQEILSHPEILRPFPSYFELDLTTDSPVKPMLYPELTKQGALPLDLAKKLDAEIRSFGWRGDATVCLGGWGEPMLHPEFEQILGMFLTNPGVSTVFVETYGLDLTEDVARRLAAMPDASKLNVILRISTLKKDRYRFLYGADRFDDALKNIVALEQMERPFAVYVEMLKIKEVEDEITPYYDRFENSSVHVILNKYNRYIDALPERRVSDLTPLHRDFCWHLARDFYLRPDGTAAICKQDARASKGPSQDFRLAGVKEILSRTAEYHGASVRGEHDRIPMPCLSCDEWYTFNG